MSTVEMSQEAEWSGGQLYGRPREEVQRLAAVGMMTTGIVHDLGNVIQVIASVVRLMEHHLDAGPADLRPLVIEASESVDRAAALNRQLLGFSGGRSARDAVVRLDAALAAIGNPIRWMVGPDIHVELSFGEDVPAVFCNARDFENVVLNLVVNAKDAAPDGGRLCISVDCGEGEGDPVVMLRVSDTGCGMSPETAKRAFQPRFTTKPPGRGNGLGLAMVGEFARRAGGSVQIESAMNRGTSVILRLPAYSS